MVKVEVEVLLYLRVCKSFAAVRVKDGSIQSGPPREGELASISINKTIKDGGVASQQS